eukprot:TRINITY_DN29991_c0_g2_i1.p1 TRINITY_DN29991_c0_g2~~TRINITY_DN29991_c0_g2_i1.p1  ORF type:complete len:1499 (-),score=434.72 TRINITY_DN29991_c0_g2_i1:563-5059(-)
MSSTAAARTPGSSMISQSARSVLTSARGNASRPAVNICIVTHLDGFRGAAHAFRLDLDLREQLVTLCEQEGWAVEGDGRFPGGPVLLHGASDFILSDDELPRLPIDSETRLAGAAEVLDRLVATLSDPMKDSQSVLALETFVHNGRPNTWFLDQSVKRNIWKTLCDRPVPTTALEWEALLAAFMAVLECAEAQDIFNAEVQGRTSCRSAELALLALETAPTRLGASYACAFLRQALLAGPKGLAAVYRAELQLRKSGECEDISFSRSLVQVAMDDNSDALQLLNDTLAHCDEVGGEAVERFKRELEIEAQAAVAGDVLGSLLDELSPHERLGTVLRFAATSESRLFSGSAGLIAAQAAREEALHGEMKELRKRLELERDRLHQARLEIRRLATALTMVADFVKVVPTILQEGLVQLLKAPLGGAIRWRKKHTPLHIAADYNRPDIMPLLVALKVDPHTKDSKSRTALDIANNRKYAACADALRGFEKHGSRVDEMPESFNVLMEDVTSRSATFCAGVQRCLARWRWKSVGRQRLLSVDARTERGYSEVELPGRAFGPQSMQRSRIISTATAASDEDDERGLAALDDEKVELYRRLLETLGEEQLMKRLRSPPELGGLALDEAEVKLAMEKIRLPKTEERPKEEAAEAEPASAHGKGPAPKGKGKGPGAAPAAPKGGGKGKGKANQVEPSKKEFKPPKRMKPMWWNRVILDPSQQSRQNIWQHVPDYLERLHSTKFSELFAQLQPTHQAAAPSDATKKEAGPQLLRVIKDRNLILAKEIAFKPLPRPQVIADALMQLDGVVLTRERLLALHEHACPSDELMILMKEAREASPDTPWALAESYLWEVGQVPFFKARLKCFLCIQSYHESLGPITEDLSRITRVCQDLRASAVLREYLGCILACGNYLNGGTNRGRADGFEIEQLGKLHLVKDNSGKDLRYFLGTELSPGGVFADIGERLFRDLTAFTALIKRRSVKTSEGADLVTKQVGGSVEDLESVVRHTQKDFEEQEELLNACLQTADLDPADPLRMDMPWRFEEAREAIDRASSLVEATKAEYRRVQAHFSCTAKCDEFFLLWDEALLPADVLAFQTKVKTVTPNLTLDRSVAYEHFVSLWDFSDKKEKMRQRRKAEEAEKEKEKEGAAAAATTSAARPPAAAGKARQQRREPRQAGERTINYDVSTTKRKAPLVPPTASPPPETASDVSSVAEDAAVPVSADDEGPPPAAPASITITMPDAKGREQTAAETAESQEPKQQQQQRPVVPPLSESPSKTLEASALQLKRETIPKRESISFMQQESLPKRQRQGSLGAGVGDEDQTFMRTTSSSGGKLNVRMSRFAARNRRISSLCSSSSDDDTPIYQPVKTAPKAPALPMRSIAIPTLALPSVSQAAAASGPGSARQSARLSARAGRQQSVAATLCQQNLTSRISRAVGQARCQSVFASKKSEEIGSRSTGDGTPVGVAALLKTLVPTTEAEDEAAESHRSAAASTSKRESAPLLRD